MDVQSELPASEKSPTISCPWCKGLRKVPMSNIAELGRAFLATCTCGHSFNICFDRRKSGRISAKLHGIFTKKGSPKRFPIEIVDLSNTGIGFKLKSYFPIQVDDIINIEFTLDTPYQPVISCEGTVCNLRTDTVGVKLISIDSNRKDFGFYLM